MTFSRRINTKSDVLANGQWIELNHGGTNKGITLLANPSSVEIVSNPEPNCIGNLIDLLMEM